MAKYSNASLLPIFEMVKNQSSELVENESIEFKEYGSERALHNDSELPGELSALSNNAGGVLIVGVRDGKKIHDRNWPSQLVGFPRVDAVSVAQRLAGKLQNVIDLRVENIIFEAKNYVAIFVTKNRSSIVMTSSGKAYIREGRSSRPMSPEELERAVKSLQNYDWSADFIEDASDSEFSMEDVSAAFERYCQIRGSKEKPTRDGFLEAIEAKKNGLITKGGLLFLGTPTAIKKHIGDIEFRFSWKEGVTLKMNDVWAGNLWTSIERAKNHFNKCVSNAEITYDGNKFRIPNLDPDAFHEAFLNAIAHRDYSTEGMVMVEFTDSLLQITSPGLFYGGVSADNITYHAPRHRNKALARTLMEYKFVDRAGMGIMRMGVKSLIYGRSFPAFEETTSSIRVAMQAEYFRPGIFALTSDQTDLHIPDLLMLNALYEKGEIEIHEAMTLIQKTARDPWAEVNKFISRWPLYVELGGTKESIHLKVTEAAKKIFNVQRSLRVGNNSDKYVALFKYLRNHKDASSAEIMDLLVYTHASTTSRFLNEIEWIEKTGRSVATRWRLVTKYS